VIDLAALTFLDAAGLTAFVKAHDLARSTGVVLRACNGSGDVDTVLRITDVADLLQMSDLVVDADTLDPATSFGG